MKPYERDWTEMPDGIRYHDDDHWWLAIVITLFLFSVIAAFILLAFNL